MTFGAKDRNAKQRVTAKHFLLAAISCLFALMLAEIACRILIPPQPSIRFQQDVDELQSLKLDEVVLMIQNDPELFWRLTPNTIIPAKSGPFFGIIASGQSLRENHEIPMDKPTDETRILFLGDSCTFGYGVAHDATFVEVAESLLANTSDGTVKCINAGVPGYTLFQGYRYLATEGLRYQPDLVVLTFGLNDYTTWDHIGDADHYAALKKMQPPGQLRRIRICQLIWALVHSPPAPQPSAEKRPRMLPGEFADTLTTIQSLLEKERVPMLIIVWPTQTNTKPDVPSNARNYWQMEMASFGQAHPLSTTPPVNGALDLVPVIRDLVSQHGAEAVYFDQVHVNPTGHQAIGQAIADHLRPWLKSH